MKLPIATLFGMALLAGAATTLVTCSSSDEPDNPEPSEELTVTVDRPIQLSEEARIPQDDPSFDRADVSDTAIAFHYTKAPTIKLAEGNIVAGTGGNSAYLRRIVSITEESDTLVAVSTEAATITDLIKDGAFSIDFKPGASQWTVHEEPGIGGRQLGIEGEISIFSFGPGGGFECAPVVGVDKIPIVPILRPDFSHRVEIDIVSSLSSPFGELKAALFSVKGSVDVGFEIDTSLTGGVQCGLDLIEYIREIDGNPSSMKFERHVTFAVGPVPMELTIFLEPIFKIEGTVDAQIERIELSAIASMSLETGVKFENNEWNGIFNASASGNLSGAISDDVVAIGFTAKASAGVRVGGLLYDTAGPFFNLTGFLEDKFTAHLDTCVLNSRASFGAEVAVGLKAQIPFIAKEIAKITLDPFPLAGRVIANLSDPLPFCPDAAVPDAGIVDAGIVDAGGLDAGVEDAAVEDAGIDAAIPDAGLCPCNEASGCMRINGRNIYKVTMADNISGNTLCGDLEQSCVDTPVFSPPDLACRTFHPGATTTSDSNGWRQSVYCGPGLTGLACEPSGTDHCHNCPACLANSLSCGTAGSVIISEIYVECSCI